MLPDALLSAWLAALAAATAARAACTSDLLIDNFMGWTRGVNNLDWPNGDDGTMESIAGAPGQVVFEPRDDGSYFYESFDCIRAVTEGYTAIRFSVEEPAGGWLALELQSTENCDNGRGDSYRSSYRLVSDLAGRREVVTVPFEGFDNNPNYDAVVGLVWSGFSEHAVQWAVGNITLVCGGTTAAPTTPTPTPTPTASPTNTATRTTTPPPATTSSPSPGTCSNLLIDDWESQSRLTFLGYNAMGEPSSDDGTMASVVVRDQTVALSPRDRYSYLYSQFGCLDAAGAGYGGISLRVSAPPGASFSVTLAWYDDDDEACGGRTGTGTREATLTTSQLGWAFDGTERLYSLPFSAYSAGGGGGGVDTTRLRMIFFSDFTAAATVVFGPMSFYCGSTPSEYTFPPEVPPPPPVTVPPAPAPAPTGSGGFVVDDFARPDLNALGEWHGADDDEGMTVTYGNHEMTLRTNNSDLSWYTQLWGGCADLRGYAGGFLHIEYSGSNKFTVALQQHNARCDEAAAPFPETWDSVEAARYAASATDIYVPISHFAVNLTRAVGFSLKGFYTAEPTTLRKIEIVDALPDGWGAETWLPPPKLASGRLVFACTRPNSFAFAIDDGDPRYAARVRDIIRQAGVPVTFFAVGLPLLDEGSGLAALYRELAAEGHQIGLHSFTHPAMEGLPDEASIDWEYRNAVGAAAQVFGEGPARAYARYFRPPFGTEGARMRQRLAAVLGDPSPYIVHWSVDVEDWLWAESDTPGRQLDAFERDLARGGNLVVMHYLYNSTVELLPEFIRRAKATGKQLMRVDQCMEDPEAPPLP